MKLILKQVEPAVEDMTFIDGALRRPHTFVAGPLALYTEDGQLLPGQTRVNMHSEGTGPVTLTVTFTVDGDEVSIRGWGYGDLSSTPVAG